MNLNIPGLDKLRAKKIGFKKIDFKNINIKKIDFKKIDIKKIDMEKINSTKDKIITKLTILKDKIVSLIIGKTLLNELIRLNRRVITIMFLVGLLLNTILSLALNYGDFQKKIKRLDVSKKINKIWTDKDKLKSTRYNRLKVKYDKVVKGKYLHSDITEERELLEMLAKDISKKSSNYVSLQIRSFKEDVSSNTLEATLDIKVKRMIMRPILINILLENGYFIETFTFNTLKIRKLKDK